MNSQKFIKREPTTKDSILNINSIRRQYEKKKKKKKKKKNQK